ncbi:MAG: hypothetical protein DRG20_04020 [Deltaproteobacteria bacterium]|nr:ATP synthase F0 subunit B [Deltaproteobacteria bacterium]RLA89886.1 MAG: hypothetical protein DRG20_04020 [Deltaproteobacteria bacterium]
MINLDSTLLIQAAIFIIFMLILNRFFFRPVLKLLATRYERSEGYKEWAKEMDRKAEELYLKYQETLKKARQDAMEIRLKIKQEGINKSNQILSDMKAEIEKELPQIKSNIQKEAEKALKKLKEMEKKLAYEIAEKLLGRSIS